MLVALAKAEFRLVDAVTGQTQLTIAVPVFNGEMYLDEALANILGERSLDLRVVVYDNASTDRSVEIAAAWAKNDPRVQLVRRPENIGALRNFADAALRADTPYFAWRAYDDLSSPGYFKTLIAALETTPAAILAIANCQTVKPKKRDRMTLIPAGVLQPSKAIADAHPGWLYGVWRTSYAQSAVTWTSDNAPAIWGWDHLALLHAALSGSFIGCPDTLFVRRLTKGPEKARAGVLSEEKQKVRQQILSVGQQLISSRRTVDRTVYLNLWDSLVERRIVRRRVETFGDFVAKIGIRIRNRVDRG